MMEKSWREEIETKKKFQELKCGKVDIPEKDKQEEPHVTTTTRREVNAFIALWPISVA